MVTTVNPLASAILEASWARRDLPIPGGPEMTISEGRADTRSNVQLSMHSSSLRLPTNEGFYLSASATDRGYLLRYFMVCCVLDSLFIDASLESHFLSLGLAVAVAFTSTQFTNWLSWP